MRFVLILMMLLCSWGGAYAADDGLTRLHAALENAQRHAPELPPSDVQALNEAVDALTPSELAQALPLVKGQSYAQGAVLLRQAKLAYHLRQDDAARALITRFYDQAPKHPLTAQAQALEKALAAAKTPAAMKIGVLLPLSGEYKPVGAMLYQGIEVAAKEALAQNPGLEIIVRDTKGLPEVTAAEMDKLVREHNVVAVIGPFVGPESKAAAQKAEELGVPIVLLSPKDGMAGLGANVFRLALTPEAQAKALVGYAFDVLGKHRVAVLQPIHSYGDSLASAFLDEAVRRGGTLAGHERYEDTETTFKGPARHLVGRYHVSYVDVQGGPCRDAEGWHCAKSVEAFPNEDRAALKSGRVMAPKVDFDVLFIPDSAERVAMLLAALAVEEADFDTHQEADYRRYERKEHMAGYKVRPIQLLGSDRWNQAKLIDRGGKWVVGSVFVDGFYPSESNPRSLTFEKAFTTAYNTAPNANQAAAYDALALVANLVTTQKPATRATMRELLQSLPPTPGASAPDLHTDSRGEILGTPTLLTVKDGQITRADVPSAPKEESKP